MLRSNVGELYDRCVDFYGNNIAITHGSRSVSYDEMGTNAKSLARALQDHGVLKGENIALLMANCPEYFFCEYALAKIGAVRVPLAVLLSPKDHVYMMNEAQCTTLIYHQSMRQRVEEMIPELKTVTRFICVGEDKDPMPGHLLLAELMANSPPDAHSGYYRSGRPRWYLFYWRHHGSAQRGHAFAPGLGIYLCHGNARVWLWLGRDLPLRDTTYPCGRLPDAAGFVTQRPLCHRRPF